MALFYIDSPRKPWSTEKRGNVLFVKKAYSKTKKSEEPIRFFNVFNNTFFIDSLMYLEVTEFLPGFFEKTNTKFLPHYRVNVLNILKNKDLLNSYYKTELFFELENIVTKMNAITNTNYNVDWEAIRKQNSSIRAQRYFLFNYNEPNVYIETLDKCLKLFRLTDIFYLSYLNVLFVDAGPTKFLRTQEKNLFSKLDDNGTKQILVKYGSDASREVEDNDYFYLEICNNLSIAGFLQITKLLDITTDIKSLSLTESINLLTNIEETVYKKFNNFKIFNDTENIKSYYEKTINPSTKFKDITGCQTYDTIMCYIFSNLIDTEQAKEYKDTISKIIESCNYTNNYGVLTVPISNFNRLSSFDNALSTVDELTRIKMNYFAIVMTYILSQVSYQYKNVIEDGKRKYLYGSEYGVLPNSYIPIKNNIHIKYIKGKPIKVGGGVDGNGMRYNKLVHAFRIPSNTYPQRKDFLKKFYDTQLFTLKNSTVVASENDVMLPFEDRSTGTEYPNLLKKILKFIYSDSVINKSFWHDENLQFSSIDTELWDLILRDDIHTQSLNNLNAKQFAFQMDCVKRNFPLYKDLDVVKGFVIMNIIFGEYLSTSRSYELSNKYAFNSFSKYGYIQESKAESYSDTFMIFDPQAFKCENLNRNLDLYIHQILDSEISDAVSHYIENTKEFEEYCLNEYVKIFEGFSNMDSRNDKLNDILNMF